jgi:hypothetical protein
MSIFKHIGVAAITLTATASWAGGESAAEVEKPYISVSQSQQLTAVVEAIDHETREVTLRESEDNAVTFIVDENTRNLDQVGVGDQVDVELIQSMSIEVVTNPGMEPGVGSLSTMERTTDSVLPGAVAMGSQVVTATVEEINIEANTFKLKGPDGIIEEFTARNPENLKRAEVGDLVIITQTETMAISVQKAPAE